MSLQKQITEKIKEAMKSKDTVALEALRAIKSAILLEQTKSGSQENILQAKELQLLQKLVKQRKDSAAIFTSQKRNSLAESELAQAKVIEQFLPQQLSEEKITEIVQKIIESQGASSMKDMGKVMAIASKELAAQAEGKTIAKVVKKLLS